MRNDFKIKLINCKEDDLIHIGFDKAYVKKGINKHKFRTIKIYDLNCAQANILKQTALSTGTDCAVHKQVITGKVELSDCILSGTISQLEKICEKLKYQPLKLSSLASQISDTLFYKPETLMIRDIVLDWKTPYIMGILNLTPDSFSDGGEYNTTEKAISHYNKMIDDGADIIDIGGESTRPFSQKITVEEEISRVIPVIEKIRQTDKKTLISIDTRNAKTAQEALKAGADIINDISALDWDKEMLNVIVNNKCPVILNHSSASPDIMQKNTDYTDVVDDIYNYLDEKIDRLTKAGISKNSIIIDPGIGFGKTTEQNFEILKRIHEFQTLGCAILIGHSRKNFIKETINTESKEKLDIATAIISEKLAANGVNILRVHNVVNHDIVKRINNLFI